jgi:hypothetical protein
MKRLLLSIFLIAFISASYGQIIRGTVIDNKTKEALFSASVYINGSSVGTLTDQDGNFKLDISRYRSMPITVSAIGYYSGTFKDFSSGRPLLIYLNPKTFELDEVVVKARSHPLERRENLTTFRSEFLGTTSNSLQCKIMNEDDIRFKYSADKDTLKAFTSKPLLIENKALGYKLTYFLDKFEYYPQSKSFYYCGNIIFHEDSTLDASKKQLIEKKRRFTYLGSRMHFFRSLWIDDLNANGFTVRNTAEETIGYNKIVYKQNSRSKYLSYHTNLSIAYYSKQPTSFILLKKDKVYFDATGYFDPSLISWEGEMAKQRIADLLPFEYHPKQENP